MQMTPQRFVCPFSGREFEWEGKELKIDGQVVELFECPIESVGVDHRPDRVMVFLEGGRRVEVADD